MDIAEHTWKCSEFSDLESCLGQVYKISPSEVILEKDMFSNDEIKAALSKKYNLNIFYYDFIGKPYSFLCDKFSTENLEGYGIENKNAAQRASALLLSYIGENQKTDINFLQNLSYESFHGFMDLDESTIKSLDIIFNVSTGSKTQGTLFGALDKTQTPMGKRYLREQLLHPLQDVKEIKQRQAFISAFKQDTILLDKVRSHLKYIADIDAILTRLSLERAGPRDLLTLKKSLISIKEVISLIETSKNTELKKLIS